jgi:arsenite-transporting ATPase
MTPLEELTTRHLFFTGKGGVGKTSNACATALALAERGRRVLLVSTDPASNLDEVLGVRLGGRPTPVAEIPGLFALNIDPAQAAREYRERIVGPYRGILPAAAVASIEEQLSGACTVEIAAFDEFTKLLGDTSVTSEFDHIVFDTAPTGHTLRLLELPAAWTGFLETSTAGVSCLGPLSGLKAQQALYKASRETLEDAQRTTMVLVCRPERSSLDEAERTRKELATLGILNQRLLLNGVFVAQDRSDHIARALEERGRAALAQMPPGLAALPREEVPLVPFGLVGIEALRALHRRDVRSIEADRDQDGQADSFAGLEALLPELARRERGVIMTMGKGGVGKTTVAIRIAGALARLGHRVHLTTTDPAGRVSSMVSDSVPGLKVTRIDPAAETRAYVEEVLRTAGSGLDAKGRALLEEDLRSPCTEEIAVFRAFARVVDEGKDGFVVVDTAPTGHTLLLLDAAEAFHREVQRSLSEMPASVRELLPRLRDPDFTRVCLVTLPEATPVHEAAQLQQDLSRAGIKPFAWIVNQCLTPLDVRDPVLRRRRAQEGRYIDEVRSFSSRGLLVPWLSSPLDLT